MSGGSAVRRGISRQSQNSHLFAAHNAGRVEKELRCAHGRIQQVMHEFSDDLSGLYSQADLIRFLVEKNVIPTTVIRKWSCRYTHVEELVMEMMSDGVIEVTPNGCRLSTTARQDMKRRAKHEEQRRKTQQQSAIEATVRPDSSVPGFSWSAYNKQQLAIS